MDDIFAVQDEIARAVAGALQIALLGEQPPSGPARGGSGPAYNAHLQGRYFRQLNTLESLATATGYFDQAIAADPAFAPAWAELSLTHSTLGAESYAPLDAAFSAARRAAERAVALDARLAEGHTALSVVRRVYGEALLLARRAVSLDPLNVAARYRVARYETFAGQLDAARASSAKTLELNPAYPAAHHGLAMALLGQGRAGEALAELSREAHPLWQGFGYAVAYHRLGRTAEAEAALTHFIDGYQTTAAAQIAEVYAGRGDLNATMQWLEQAYRLRDPGLSQLKVLPAYWRFNSEPRY